MNATVMDAEHLHWLEAQLRRNRFLPAPPAELTFCGDGDYRAIGAEFLGHFVRLADLRPHERVLDIGCGIGRMAVPLTQFLSEEGHYTGIDIVRDGIAWCDRTISAAYPNFCFQHLDLHHPLYNQTGLMNAADIRLPFPDNSFDFICLVSVLTHIDGGVLLNYAREIARLLAPGGRCFATAFLVNPPVRDALRAGQGRLAFDPDAEGPEFHADLAAPMAAVAFDENFLLEKFLRFGRRRRRPAVYGCWSGRPGAVFQDVCIFE
ncbi:MAG: class I SAM-dependent methyltransferase [Rhodopila sp.]|nr:class I SAM-dependent methyltransferase [Rhodopila sp.]